MQAPSTTRVLRSPSSSVSAQRRRPFLWYCQSSAVSWSTQLGDALLVVVVGEVRAERAAAVVGPVGVDALAAAPEDAGPARRQPGQVAAEDLLSSAGSRNSTHARGKTRSTSGTAAEPTSRASSSRTAYLDRVRLGVLDIGSNTGHLLVVDAHGGAAPLPAYSFKEPLRLAEHLDADGSMTESGIVALTDFVAQRPAGRRGQGLRGDARLRHLGGPRRHQLRRGARPGQGRGQGRHQRAARGGRGPADLPRRTPLVRLVVGPAAGLRHRRRLAGDRRQAPTRPPTSRSRCRSAPAG